MLNAVAVVVMPMKADSARLKDNRSHRIKACVSTLAVGTWRRITQSCNFCMTSWTHECKDVTSNDLWSVRETCELYLALRVFLHSDVIGEANATLPFSDGHPFQVTTATPKHRQRN